MIIFLQEARHARKTQFWPVLTSFLAHPGPLVGPNDPKLPPNIVSLAHTHGLGVKNLIRKKSKKNAFKLTPPLKV